MSVKLHEAAFKQAQSMIESGDYVTDTDWSDTQPSTNDENRYLEKAGYEDFSNWYLGIDRQESKETKGRQSFPYGDFKRVHRSGVIAIKQRAAQYDHPDIEKAADKLLTMIDKRENGSS